MEREGESEINGYPEAEEEEGKSKSKQEIHIRSFRNRCPVHERGQRQED